MGRVVDSFAQYRYQPTVKDCMYVPQPPTHKPAKQGPGRDMSEIIGSHQRSNEQLAELRINYRQQQVLAREIGWQRRAADEEHARQSAVDQRRYQVERHMESEQARIRDQQMRADNTLATKRQITEQLNRRFQENAENLGEREARKLATLSVNRINRNTQAAERQAEAQLTYAHRQAAKEVNRVARIEANLARISELDCQAAAQQNYKTRCQSNRVAQFEKTEREAQTRKEYSTMVVDQKQGIVRSQVLP